MTGVQTCALPISYEGTEEIGRMSLITAGTGHRLVLKKEQNVREKELVYLSVELCDEQGIVVSDHDLKIFLEVEGDAVPLGFGSGDPKPEYNYKEGVTRTYHGRALIILKKQQVFRYARVSIMSEDGMSAEVTL